MNEVLLKIRGKKHWLWRAVDQDSIVLDVLVQGRRDQQAAKWFLVKCSMAKTVTSLVS